MATTKAKLSRRTEVGKNSVDKLREEGLVPGVVYSRGGDNVNISISEGEFSRVFKEAGSASIINLDLEGEVVPAIIKEVQRHPFKNQVLHVDFQKVNMDEKIRITVPINLINRDSIQIQPSVLVQLLDTIDIECLPGDIPEIIDVDVANMTLEDPITVGDLDIAKNEDITILRELDEPICTLTVPTVEETEEDEDAEGEEVEEAEETEEE